MNKEHSSRPRNNPRKNNRNNNQKGPPRQSNHHFFKVQGNYTEDSPIFEKPKVVGYWSIDEARKVQLDASQLRYYVPRNDENLNLDLSEGLEDFIKRPDSIDDEGINHLLRWIEANRQRLLSTHADARRWLQAYFICYRGTLCKILKSPFSGHAWIICAAKFRGSIYLSHFETDYEKMKTQNKKVVNFETAYWGSKFRQYMFSDDPNKPPDTSKPVNESERFYCVFRSRLNRHNLLYRAEVDGICCNRKLKEPLPFNRFKCIKVRTGKLTETIGQKMIREKVTSLDMWFQAYLTGADEIVRGLREDCDGIVRRIETTSISDMATSCENFWDPKICLNFADKFLDFVDRTVVNDCDKTIYKFERGAFKDVIVTELPPTGEYAFLPDWYKAIPDK